MRVIHLLNSLKHGGAENVALNYAIATNTVGISSVFIAKSHDEKYKKMVISNGIEIYENLTKDLIADDAVFMVHSNQNLIKLIPFLRILRRRKIKVVYIQHLNYTEKKYKYLSRLINYICTDFVQITPITEELVYKYIKINKHFIVNFYINKYALSNYSVLRKEVRDKINLNDDIKLFMFSAVFKPGKGLADFLEIAKYYKDEPNFRFLILGDGPERQLVDQYCYDNTIWLGFQNDIEKYLIASDVYVFTSLFKQEMMPMALIEAVNCDKSILAFNTQINNFCLTNQTFDSIHEMIEAINLSQIPSSFTHYDEKYAIGKILNLIG